MAAVTPPFSTFALFLVLTALVAASCLTILASYRRHLPST
jgi:hypothetical protein